MYVCMYVCVCVCMYVCMYVMYVYNVCVSMYVFMCVCVNVCFYVCVCVCVYVMYVVCVYMYTWSVEFGVDVSPLTPRLVSHCNLIFSFTSLQITSFFPPSLCFSFSVSFSFPSAYPSKFLS